jgi:rhodanese-related sulfurtransferase
MSLAQAQRGGYGVVTTDELWELYQIDDSLLLVDTRQDWEFAAGHIKGAVIFPMEPNWWARWSKKDKLRALLAEDKKRTIVFY